MLSLWLLLRRGERIWRVGGWGVWLGVCIIGVGGVGLGLVLHGAGRDASMVMVCILLVTFVHDEGNGRHV